MTVLLTGTGPALFEGGRDAGRGNESASRSVRCEHELAVVPGVAHLFGEPSALEQVSRQAGAWFPNHLIAVPSP
jgi:putative phosphoribosyl transferase